MKPIFQKNLQFGDIWPQMSKSPKKIAQIKVFGHFLDFAWLVFLDFPHTDRWAWFIVVFLQFAGSVNAFLLIERKGSFLDVWQGSNYASALLKKVYIFYRYSDCSEYLDFQSFKRFMEMEQKVCF